MTTRVDIDRIPEARRPPEVETLAAEARGLRDRLRSASETLASAEATLEQAQQADAAAAAQRLREGAPTIGSEQPAVEKARKAVEQARRNERAVTLAAGAAEADLASAIRAHADGWLTSLEAEQAEARDRAIDALAQFEAALAAMRDVASSAGWIQGALADGRFDRPARQPLLGSVAPTSAKLTANGAALRSDEIVAYCRELLEPPLPPQRAQLAQLAEQTNI